MGRLKTNSGRTVADLTGMTFGKLTVVELSGMRHSNGGVLWVCKCLCGNDRLCLSGSLKHGGNSSCGCSITNKTHGESKNRLHRIWSLMIHRCYKPTSSSYHLYGAAGITVCEEWKNDYFVFKKWALENGYDDALSIDRYPNKSGNYEPTNCRWATPKQQNNNRVDNITFSYLGLSKTASQWADEYGLPKSTVYQRLQKLGWDIEIALKTPLTNGTK